MQGVLAARIDRLAPDEKALLQQLAVIGREFPLSLIRQVITQPEEELYRLLASLQRKEFLYEQPAFPEVEYIFKHALTQEVAYSSVLQERRKALTRAHRRRRSKHCTLRRLEEHYSELAHHYSRSGNTEKAVEYLSLAGQQAVQRSANAEAITHLTTALELLKTLPDTAARARQELTLHLSLGASLMATKGYSAAEVEQTYTRAQELCLQVGEPLQVAQVLFGLWAFYVVRGNHTAALALGEQFLTVAHRQQDSTLSLVVHAVLGGTLLWLGEFAPAQAHLDQACCFLRPRAPPRPGLPYGTGPGVTGSGLCSGDPLVSWLPRPGPGASPSRALLSPSPVASLELGGGAGCCCLRASVPPRGPRGPRPGGGVTDPRSRARVCTSGWAVGTSLQGWALVERAAQSGAREQREAGLVQLREGLAALRATGAELCVPLFLGALAQGYAQGGQAEEGLRVVAEALAMVEKNEERWNEAELYRIKGELTLQTEVNVQGSKFHVTNLHPPLPDPQVEAEACFLKAIEIARKPSKPSRSNCVRR